MAFVLLLLCLLYLELIVGFDFSVRTCFKGNRNPSPVQVRESFDPEIFRTSAITGHTVSIDPCIERNSSIVEITWKRSVTNRDRDDSTILCLRIETILVNLTKCYRLTSYLKTRRKMKCWFQVDNLNSAAVVSAIIQSHTTTVQSGEIYFSGTCEDVCKKATPMMDKPVVTCGVPTSLGLSDGVRVIRVQLVCKKCEKRKRHEVAFSQNNETIIYYVDKDTMTGFYNLEILTRVEVIPQSHDCKHSQKIYINCDTFPTFMTAPTTVIEVTSLTIHMQIGTTIGAIMLVAVVILTILYFVNRRRRQHGRTDRQTGVQVLPLNNRLLSEGTNATTRETYL